MILEYIKSDLCRYVGKENTTLKMFLKQYFFNSGFKFSFWLRLTKSKNIIISKFANIQRRRFGEKYILDISADTEIGFGLYIGHGGCIIINPSAKIGNNVNLSQFTTVGSNHGQAATIGDNVYIGPSVCIVEDVTIGNNVKIGAGAVVTKNIPENATAAGVPAKILKISDKPNNYVNRRWECYDYT